MSVRFAFDADRPAIVDVLQAAEAGAAEYTFVDLDGHALVEEADGVMRGVAIISLARPYTVIREMAIRPEYRKGWVLANLAAAVFAAAQAHGSQGVEGFKSADDPEWIEFSRQLGASIAPGVRVRWLVPHPLADAVLNRQRRA